MSKIRESVMEKKVKDFEEKTGMTIKELDERYYERKEFYDKFLEYRMTFKPEKVGPGKWKSKCYNCGKEFVVKQYNYRNVPKVCPECKESGQTCIICGKPISFGKYLCDDCWREWGQLLPTIREGHKKQGQKIRGEKNPAKRKDVREKISRGVKKSYEENPELKRERAKYIGNVRGKLENMSKLERIVADVLIRNGVSFRYEPKVVINGVRYYPDFVIRDRVAVEVAGYKVDNDEGLKRYYEKVRKYLKVFDKVVVVTYSDVTGFFVKEFENEPNVEVIGVEDIDWDNLIEIGVEDITNVDYGHWISFHESKCHRYHWHTSWNISAYVKGYLRQGESMLIDYGDLKKIVKEVVEELDHKILVREDFIVSEDGEHVEIVYDSDWMRRMYWPKREVLVVMFEPTAENIAKYLANKVMDRLPGNILEVTLVFREGTNNVAKATVRRKVYNGEEDLERILRYWDLISRLSEEVDGE